MVGSVTRFAAAAGLALMASTAIESIELVAE